MARAMRRPWGSKAPGAADPVEDVRRLAGHDLAHAEVGRPRAAIGGHATERVAALDRRLERPRRGGVDGPRLHQRAPEVDELVQHLDLEGAGPDARRARRARPRFLGADQALERATLAHRLERRLDHAPRVERLAGRRRRAHRRASAAADARRGVEQLGPGEPLRLERGGLRRGRAPGGPASRAGGARAGPVPRPCAGGPSPRSGRRGASRARRAMPQSARWSGAAGTPAARRRAGQGPSDERPAPRTAGRSPRCARPRGGSPVTPMAAEEGQDPERDAAPLEPGRLGRRGAATPSSRRR